LPQPVMRCPESVPDLLTLRDLPYALRGACNLGLRRL
jgi:hypothetical protein